jgi:glyoxylase-like metal-dependent hydrolase (beta-lactamase superfamily II)
VAPGRLLVLLALAAALPVLGGRIDVEAQQARPAPAAGIRILPVRGNIFVISGAGSNVVASVGKDGVMLVDSGSSASSEALVAAVQELSRQVTAPRQLQRSCVGVAAGCDWWNSSALLPTTSAPRMPKGVAGIVNTSFDPDHMGGNAAFMAAGKLPGARQPWIIAHEGALPDDPQSIPFESLPTESYFGEDKRLNFFNGEGVIVFHRKASHTGGDSVVQFRESEVIAAGDIVNMAQFPVIDLEKGGSAQGIVDTLNWLLDMMVVEHMMEGGTIVVPGHGRLTDSADVSYYRDMMTIITDRVRAAIKKGMNVDQVKGAGLTKDYDPRFGRNPAYTPAMFIEAVYRSLNTKG